MICKLPIQRDLWHDSSSYRIYVHRSGCIEIARMRDGATTLLPIPIAHVLACRVAAVQRSNGGALADTALDRLCADFDHLLDEAADRIAPPENRAAAVLGPRECESSFSDRSAK